MNNNKLLIRIISIALIVIILFGLVATCFSVHDNHVHAAEMNDTSDSANRSQSNTENNKPTQLLPDGFEYVQGGDGWLIAKTKDNTNPAVAIETPDGFDALAVTIFVGNLATHEVTCYTLDSMYNYVSSMELSDGYYVIFGNGFAWSTSSGAAYAINGSRYQYVYVGSNYDPTLYGVEFQTTNGIFSIQLEIADDGMEKVAYNSYLTVDPSNVQYPENAKLEKIKGSDAEDLDHAETPTTQTKEDGDSKISLIDLFVGFMKRSGVMLIIIALCYVGLTIIKMKKQVDAEQQAEKDKYDDKRID